ncbi:Pvc16 family protein [Larkinella rosea]|nr:Pvc16 family protein [Larkinella rosea]
MKIAIQAFIMLNTALLFLKKYLKNNPSLEQVDIDLKYLPSKTTDLEDASSNIFITLLSIEEERSTKSPYRYERKTDVSPARINIINSELALNLYLMISSSGDYVEALKNISKVIATFANKNSFEKADFEAVLLEGDDIDPLSQLSLDIQNFSLDQTNNLWQALANNIIPHIIYKVRIVAITPTLPQATTREVREINVETKTL